MVFKIVERCAASGTVGMNSAPRCPQALNAKAKIRLIVVFTNALHVILLPCIDCVFFINNFSLLGSRPHLNFST